MKYNKVVSSLPFFYFKKRTHPLSLTGRKEAPNLRLINFPHPINPPGKNPVNKNGVVYVDLLYRMMSEERHCVMLLMFVYGELSSKKNKQKNVHLLPLKKCVQFFKKGNLFLSPIKKKKKYKKHIQLQYLTLKASLRSL